MSDVTTGRFSDALTDVEQPLPAVETDRPVADRETPRETTADALRVCFPTVWGDGKIDRRRWRKRHDPIPQPFYNQDFRLWCPRCGCLAVREAFHV